MKPILIPGKALRAARFAFALSLISGAAACAEVDPQDEESEEAYDGESEALEESADPQAQIVVGVSRDSDPEKRFGGFPSVGSVERTVVRTGSSGSRSVDRTVRTGSSGSRSVDRTVRTGSSGSRSVDRTVWTGGRSGGGRTIDFGGWRR